MKRQKGFTLIELLVVIAILGVLVGVAVPSMAQFLGAGKGEAADTELGNVQVAMDMMMVGKLLEEVPEVAEEDATGDMEGFPSEALALYPNYMRQATTKGTYACTASGVVSQVTTGYESE